MPPNKAILNKISTIYTENPDYGYQIYIGNMLMMFGVEI